MKIAMLRLPTGLRNAGLTGRMLLQVHDEVVLEVPDAELKGTTLVVKEIMENAYSLKVPLATEARAGPNWGDLS